MNKKMMPRALASLPLAALLLAAPHALAAKQSPEDPTVPPVTRDKVQIVFALDTTGSMGGLIEGAKRKIWFIANEVLASKRRPELEVGLVAYRDKSDAYVTQLTPLTSDLDHVYNQLMALGAGGGGDHPEDVNAALHAAVTKMQWSDDKDVLKLVFLVGDAPPHMDYQEPKHPETSQLALRKNIYINTIQCGSHPGTTSVWQAIARNSEGRFAAIAQDGGVVALATPFDEKLGALAGELDATTLTYGGRAKVAAAEATRSRAAGFAADAPAPVRAERALAKAKAGPSDDADLVSLFDKKGDAALKDVAASEMPDEMRGKSTEEQQRILKERQHKRAAVQKKIAELEKKRAAWIASERKKSGKKKSGFDAEVMGAIEAQAAEVGLEF